MIENKKLDNGMYLETNYSKKDIRNIIKNLIKLTQ